MQNKVDRETRFNKEFVQFLVEPGEALVSVYNCFAQLMNDLEKNGIIFPKITVNTKFLNCLQHEWLKNFCNDGRNTRRSYVQKEVIEGTNIQNDAENIQRALRTTSSGIASNVQCYNCNEKGLYNCPKPRVQDSKYFMEQVLLEKQDEAGVVLTDEQNDFLFVDAFRMEEIEKLSANICLMSRIQPSNFDSDAGLSYDSAFLSEVQTPYTSYVNLLFAKDKQEQKYPKQPKIINNTIGGDQIDSNIIFDEPNEDVNSGNVEYDNNVQESYDLEELARHAFKKAEKQKIIAKKVQQQNTVLTKQPESYKEKAKESITVVGSTSGIRALCYETLNYKKLSKKNSLPKKKRRNSKVQDYALWNVIENDNSFKLVAQTTTNDAGTSTTLIPGIVTTEEKAQKKNDVKARSILPMALLHEHLMTFNQYKDAKSLFVAIETRFGGNEATKKTQKTLLKQLNKFDLDTMSIDDLYNNFKIVEQEVKGTACSNSSSQNMAFVTSPSTNSTNKVPTAYEVSTASTQSSTASTKVSTANLSDAIVSWNQDSSKRAMNVEETPPMAIVSIDGVAFDRSYMAEDEVPTNMALMAFSDSEGVGFESYNAVPPPPTGLFSHLKIDLSYSGLEEFQQPEFESYGPKSFKIESKNASENIPNELKESTEVKESSDVPLVKKLVSDDKNMAPRAVLMKTGLRPLNTARPVNTAHPKTTVHCARPISHFSKLTPSTIKRPYQQRTSLTNKSFSQTVNTARPRPVKTARPINTARPRPVNTVRPRPVNTARPNSSVVNAVRVNKVNDVKASACWVWRPTKPNGASITLKRHNYIDVQEDQGYVDSRCFRHMTRNMSYPLDFKEFNRGYVTFGGGANGGRITKTKDETSGILKKFITEIENIVDKKVKVIRCDNKTEFKNSVMNDFCAMKGIRREFSVARTPQQNDVAKKRNRVLVVKHHNKTPYELFRGRIPALSFKKPFGCHVTILNTLDHLGKFDGKSNKGFFVGYSLNSKAFRVYNIRTQKVEENLHVRFLEDKPSIAGNEPKWMFDINVLTNSMNYVPVIAGINFNDFNATNDEPQSSCETGNNDDNGVNKDNGIDDHEKSANSINDVNTVGPIINTASTDFDTGSLNINTVSPTVSTTSPEATHADFFSDKPEGDMSKINTTYQVPSTPNTRIHKDHSLDLVISDVQSGVLTRKMTKTTHEQGFISIFYEEKTHEYLNTCLFACFLSQIEPTRVAKALTNPAWVEAMQDELLQIEEEEYVCQPLGFKYPNHPDKVYKVVKALYGLHQAPRAWYKTLTMYLLDNGFHRGKIDQTLFIKRQNRDILLVQTASTPVDTKKPLVKDADGDDIDVHLYRSMIGSLMYVTASRPDIILISWQCKKQTVVATFTTEAEYFWQSATTRTLNNGEIEITATIDGKVKVVTEASVRIHLKLEDLEGISALSTIKIFDQLSLMGYVSTDDKLTFQNGEVVGSSWSGEDGGEGSGKGEGSTVPVESHHTPTGAPSTSPPHLSSPPMSFIRQETEVPQPSSPTHTHVADEAASTGVDVRHGRAAITVTSLDAGQGSGNIDKTPSMTYDSPFLRVNTLGSDEGSMSLQELTVLCTTLSQKVESLDADLKQTKQVYGADYTMLIIKVTRLEKTIKTNKTRSSKRDTEEELNQGRVGNHTEVYQFFDDMLKVFDIDDLVQLWSLVKERFSLTEPTDDKEIMLWVKLKRLFEPDDNDELWESHKYIFDITWRLYDTCGVHHVSTKKGMDIYMLVEKEYPLSRCILTQMLCAKLLMEGDKADIVDVITIGIPSLARDDFTKETIRVEYEQRPLRYKPKANISAPKKRATNVSNPSKSSSLLRTADTSSKEDNFTTSNYFSALNDE
uniref:Uncharacterized protein n=1 Tax=Tanacetum cinerariifolium TaxID=118510 RepID=A0A6L2KU94_TANCI|nr:hypothetical protein [Tanacetum cinerariifolium]